MNGSTPQVFICAADQSCIPIATELAQRFGLTVLNDVPANANSSHWTLLVESNALSLVRPDGLSTTIDFMRGKATQRSQEASFKSQPLARALGLRQLRKRSSAVPTIIDATAGFGNDGWMMASLGCEVRLLEASPVLCTMLEHALQAARDANLKAATNQNPSHSLSLINTDSIDYLTNAANHSADIVYLDPMYPQTRSTALVKKGMQLLHELIGPDSNDPRLLDAALTKATYRVVVKRPRGAPQLPGSEDWSGQITDVQSPQTRFDVYHIQNG